jgi:hypothetical protein
MPSEVWLDIIFQKLGFKRRRDMAETIREIEEIDINELKPHPKNKEIYGDDDVSDLVTLIEARGKIIRPLLIKRDFTIISGHRRWKAAKELQYKTVPCEIVDDYENEDEELADLIIYNVDREKTLTQKAREGMILETTLKSEALLRKIAALKQNHTDMDNSSTSDDMEYNVRSEPNEAGNLNDSDKGLTRNKVAKAVGLSSGKTYDRIKKVLDMVDELKKDGNEKESELFTAVINRSASAAYDLLKVDISKLSDDEKDKLKDGRIAPRVFIPPKENKSESNQSGFDSIIAEFKSLASSISKLKKSVPPDMTDKQTKKLREQIEKQIESLQSLLPM